jgi:hypothetical protein
MFGPSGSLGSAMHSASHASGAPCPRAELIEIVGDWQSRAAGILAAFEAPVYYRQDWHDRLWVAEAGEVSAFARLLSGSPLVDAARLGGTGHCIDFHHAGAASQLLQSGFVLRCEAELPRSPGTKGSFNQVGFSALLHTSDSVSISGCYSTRPLSISHWVQRTREAYC